MHHGYTGVGVALTIMAVNDAGRKVGGMDQHCSLGVGDTGCVAAATTVAM